MTAGLPLHFACERASSTAWDPALCRWRLERSLAGGPHGSDLGDIGWTFGHSHRASRGGRHRPIHDHAVSTGRAGVDSAAAVAELEALHLLYQSRASARWQRPAV